MRFAVRMIGRKIGKGLKIETVQCFGVALACPRWKLGCG